jgi:hypothetical protein
MGANTTPARFPPVDQGAQSKILEVAAAAALALRAFASTTSATTLEIGGVTKNEPSAIHATLKSGTSALVEYTVGSSPTHAPKTTIHITTSVFTGTTVSGPIRP